MDWSPPPANVTWLLPTPISFGSASYPTITLRAPSAGDVLKASAIPGASSLQVGLRLVAELSAEGVPYEALSQTGPNGLPAYLLDQMSAYLDLFGGAPLPGPLVEWQAARVAAAQAEAEAKAALTPPT